MMIIDTDSKKVANICVQVHHNCIVCGLSNPKGLHLRFEARDDGSVKATFQCNKNYEGYLGLLHGGVTMSIFDGAMCNCLFVRGQTAVTVEMATRFRHPVLTDRQAIVSARITRFSHPLYLLEAEIMQDGIVKATAKGKFYDQPKLVDELEHR
jgi:uncharacterized protein (TIGR00369 family)